MSQAHFDPTYEYALGVYWPSSPSSDNIFECITEDPAIDLYYYDETGAAHLNSPPTDSTSYNFSLRGDPQPHKLYFQYCQNKE